ADRERPAHLRSWPDRAAIPEACGQYVHEAREHAASIKPTLSQAPKNSEGRRRVGRALPAQDHSDASFAVAALEYSSGHGAQSPHTSARAQAGSTGKSRDK